MKYLIIGCLLFCVSCAPSSSDKLTYGMTLQEAEKKLEQHGATIVPCAYNFPWFVGDGRDCGYHNYYHLADGTCLQIRIQSSENPETVVGFNLGPRGQEYIGKIEWFENDDNGVNQRVETVDLSEFEAPANTD